MKKILVYAVSVLFFLSGSMASADTVAGEKLYKGGGKCKNCHKISNKKKVGPGLANVMKRAPEKWIKAWLADPQGTWAADEGYTKEMKIATKRVGKPKTRHKTRPLEEKEIADIIDFLKTL